MTEQMGNWLQTNMPPALQASLNSWCNTHAQPLLSGFLEQWMALNSQQLLQQELSRHLVPMQQALQQQQHMIGELQQTVTSQAAHIATLEASLAGVKKQVDAIPPPSAAPVATATAAASEPTPFTPTLPFQVGGSPVAPIHHPATSAIQSSQSLSPSATMGLGPRGVRPPSASSSRAVAFRDHEDGVGQSIDPKEKLRQSMTNGLARGLLGSVTAAGPGETYAGSEPQTRGAIRVHGSGARSKATGPIDIIVVDDLELARKIAHATLTKSHFKVELAADGLQAIELYKQYMGTGLKAVLMDIHLPGISGIETTERIRKIEQEAGIPPALIYGLTGDVGEDDLAKYKACGMNGCILKGKLLADAVKTAIEESSNGVQFVNLCDRQNGSSSSSSSAAAASSNASSASSTPPISSGSQSSTISNLPHASPAERLRAEASGSPPGVFGTPRAPQPRAILMDKHGGARGSVKPGIGLGRDASSSGNSPTMSTQDRIMVTPSTNGPDLLLVEDVRVSRQIAMKSLKKMGFNVVEAESGEQAVDKFKQHTQTLKYIIMDINVRTHDTDYRQGREVGLHVFMYGC